jgi:hypothetical protein
LVATVLPLVGVVLGSAGTFAGQYLATRETKKQADAAAVAATRAERKEAILAFLNVCQKVERAAEHRYQHDNKFVEGSPELTHEMWFRQKCLELVAGSRVRSTAFQYADRLMAATYGRLPKGKEVWGFIAEKREPFLDAAKEELRIASDALMRKALPRSEGDASPPPRR